MNPLDERLQTVADAVRAGSVVADVGTDHGYLVCALVGGGKCPRGYASDVRPLPLAVAAGHIRAAGLADRIETVLSDGLRELPGDALDDVVIAGMGGELIGEILTAVPWTRDTAKRYILQPMTRAEGLRRLLYKEGFALADETAACSGRFAYTVMTARYTGEVREVDELFAQTGLLYGKRDEASLRYLDSVRRRLHKQAAGLARSTKSATLAAGLYALIEQINQQTGG